MDNNFFNTVNLNCKYYTDDQFKELITNSQKGLSIIHFNCRSLNANFSNLETYLSELNYYFDIIGISETSSNPPLYELKGYDVYHVDRKHKRSGGVAIYITSNIRYKVIDKMCTTIDDVLECISVELCMENKKNVIVSCLYRQSGSSIDNVTNFIEKTYRHKKCDINLCGDFNVSLFNYDHGSGTKDFVDLLFSFGSFLAN